MTRHTRLLLVHVATLCGEVFPAVIEDLGGDRCRVTAGGVTWTWTSEGVARAETAVVDLERTQARERARAGRVA